MKPQKRKNGLAWVSSLFSEEIDGITEGRHPNAPFHVEIHPHHSSTELCNNNCNGCTGGGYRNPESEKLGIDPDRLIKTIDSFKRMHRDIDALLVDDIQFIAGKEYSQEEFFHTFNALYLSGKQIILTSDRRPEEIPKIEERLTSRFMGGLTVDIQLPDFETRVAILKQKCQEKGVEVEEQAIAFLAQMVSSNIRELEGTLSQILTACAASGGVKPSLDFVRNFFGVKSKLQSRTISPRNVLAAVAKHFNTKTSDILGSCRRQELVLPRQITMYLLREEIEISLVKIGEILGGRDHTTVIHGVKKISQRFTSDSSLRHEIMLIKQTLYE